MQAADVWIAMTPTAKAARTKKPQKESAAGYP
jgi:hypothetical protein